MVSWMRSTVPSVELPSTKMTSVPAPSDGVRLTISLMFPASFRHGTITEHAYSRRSVGSGATRAMRYWVKQRRRTPGRCARMVVQHQDRPGRYTKEEPVALADRREARER